MIRVAEGAGRWLEVFRIRMVTPSHEAVGHPFE
jgi:hypothetical protein